MTFLSSLSRTPPMKAIFKIVAIAAPQNLSAELKISPGTGLLHFVLPRAFLAVILLALAACASSPTPMEAMEADRQARHAKYQAQAERFADRVALVDYTFLGVALFEPFNSAGFTRGHSDPEGLTVYNALIPDSAFPRRSVSVAPDGTAVAILALKPVVSVEQGKAFMRDVVEALRERLPALRERDEREESYSVNFSPRSDFIQRYTTIWGSSLSSGLERDTRRGYKSEFYYLQNEQPDDRLNFVTLSLETIDRQLNVMFHVETKQATALDKISADEQKKKLKDQLSR